MEITFYQDDPKLEEYDSEEWALMEHHRVEFFPHKFFDVYLISTDIPNFPEFLGKIDLKDPISLDLEWDDELCLFQFCIKDQVLVIRHPPGPGNKILFNFLSNHKFYAKGTTNDKKMLYRKFGCNFEHNIEDISRTRLVPYGYSENFMKMCLQFAGQPTAEFKDKKITLSQFSGPILTKRQVLYAAFDVVALCMSYPNFPQPLNLVKQKKTKVVETCDVTKPKRKPVKKSTRCGAGLNHSVYRISQEKRVAYPYLIHNYKGILIPSRIKEMIPYEMDWLSTYPDDDNESYYVIFTLYQKVSQEQIYECVHEFIPSIESIQVLEFDPNYYVSNRDVYFFTNLPQRINSYEGFNDFLFCFGIDHFLNFGEIYAEVEYRNDETSRRIHTFIPHIKVDHQSIQIFPFPYFIPKLRVSELPSHFKAENIIQLFNEFEVKSVKILRRRTETEPITALVEFINSEITDEALEKINYTMIDGEEIHTCRYTGDFHIRNMKNYELIIEGLPENTRSIDLRREYSKHGKIFQAIYDKTYHVGRVQFYDRGLAKKLISENVHFQPDGSIVIVRFLPITVTNEDIINLCSPFGKICHLMIRDLDMTNRFTADVSFSSREEAMACKIALNKQEIGDREIVVDVLCLSTKSAPHWKLQQRKQWIKFDSPVTDEEVWNYCKPFGRVIDMKKHEDAYFAMFSVQDHALDAINSIDFDVSIPTLYDYVDILYKGQFYLDKFQQTQKYNIKKLEQVVVIDPVPDETSQDDINELRMMCTQQGDFYVCDSEAYPDKQRIIVYPTSRTAANRVQGKFDLYKVNGELLKPTRVAIDKVPPNPFPPPPKKDKAVFVLDPIPVELDVEYFSKLCKGAGRYQIFINKSSIDSSKNRAIFKPISDYSKDKLAQVLPDLEHNGEKFIFLVFEQEQIPASLT